MTAMIAMIAMIAMVATRAMRARRPPLPPRPWPWGLALAAALAAAPAPGQELTPAAPAGDAKKTGDKDVVNIDFDEPEPEKVDKDAESFLAPPIEQLLRDPAIAANLANGAESLNRSVDSLMDAVFYSLLTNERNVDIGRDTWFNGTFRRTVFTAPSGAYIIVDRFLLGPRYSKVLGHLQNVPVSLGIDASAEAVQIYLRTDGMRLAEQEDLPTWRRWANNWFGLVPVLAMILPPSFNQNYLYDPINELETPFSFPLDVAKFNTMPIGSIRSYALSGGIQLSPDLAGLLDQVSVDWLQRVGQVQAGAPYAVFKRGEHRINVLRRAEHNAWVGVSNSDRTGHSFNPLVGQQYFVLGGALAASVFKYNWVWKGVPASILPLNLSLEQAFAKLFDQVYEFDLTKEPAQHAYERAVRGDFITARERYLDAKEKHLDTGVTFHFARHEDRHETVVHNTPNIGVYRRSRDRNHQESEIEITDPEGKFNVLESLLNVDDKDWNILIGEREQRSQQALEMKVTKLLKPAGAAGDDSYVFEVTPDPYRLTMAFNIQDRYVDALDYQTYLEQIRGFTGLPLDQAPYFTPRDQDAERAWRQSGMFTEPRRQIDLIHVTPTYLGKFGAQATVSFSAAQLDRIIATPDDRIWGAFAAAFELDAPRWADPAVRAGLPFQAQWFEALFAYPFRLIDVRFPQLDAIMEATNGVEQLRALRTLAKPLEKLEGFYRLLDSDHPRLLARALLNLAELDQVPRRVTMSVAPAGSLPDREKKRYAKLNNKTFHAGPPFPMPDRYMRAKAELARFSLDQPRIAEHRPRLAKIQVTTQEIPASVRQLTVSPDEDGAPVGPGRHVYLTFSVRDVLPAVPLKLYVKVEQAGKIKIGKLDLAEKVIELPPVETSPGPGNTLTYQFFLTGPMSPLANYMLDKATSSGDEFQVTLAASGDGSVWSDERTLLFRFEDGKLFPVAP